jgi:hypothetical protein
MKILFYKESNLALNPDIWVEAIGRYTDHRCQLLRWKRGGKKKMFVTTWVKDTGCWARHPFHPNSFNNLCSNQVDIVHFNNRFRYFDEYQKKSLIHYHNIPHRRAPTDQDFLGFKVCNACHKTNGNYPDAKPIRWFPIDLNNTIYSPSNPTDKIKICFSPSNKLRGGAFSKGYHETSSILSRLQAKYPEKFSYQIVCGKSRSECLRIKGEHNIIIDECVTGSYHMSGFEGLAMGKMVVGWWNDENVEMLKTICPKSTRVPYDSVNIKNLECFLEKIISQNDIDYVIERGRQNRSWIEENWDIHDIIKDFINIYEDILRKT